jgi:hypothetical protein
MVLSISGSQFVKRFQYCFKSESHESAVVARVPPKYSLIVTFKTSRYGCANEGRTLTVLPQLQHRNRRTKMRTTPLFELVTLRE